MIEVSGSNGSGYRIFYPWFHRAGSDLPALRIPEHGPIRRCIVLNALIVFVLVIPYMRELRGHPVPSAGWIYLVACALLLIELGWKVQYLWLRILIQRPALAEIPSSSRLRGEHALFWAAMQVTLFALVHHGHPTHDLWWTGASMFCTLMVLMPAISSFALRRRQGT